MTKINLTPTQASGGVKGNNVRYVLFISTALVIVAFVVVFFMR